MRLCVHGELTKVLRQLPASVSTHDSLVIHVALVSYQQHLGVVPRVCLNLCRPGIQHTQQRAKPKDISEGHVLLLLCTSEDVVYIHVCPDSYAMADRELGHVVQQFRNHLKLKTKMKELDIKASDMDVAAQKL